MMNRLLAAVALCACLPTAALATEPPAATAPAKPLPPEDEVALRCGVVFALATKAAERGEPGSEGWTGLNPRGREFFTRSAAKAIDDTGMSRDDLRGVAISMALALSTEVNGAPDANKALQTKIDACLPLLPLPEPAPAK